MRNQRQSQVKTKQNINKKVEKTETAKCKVVKIKISHRKEVKILIKIISEAIEEIIKNNEMTIVTLNKNKIKKIKETKENNSEVKINKKNLMKFNQKIIKIIQKIIKEEASNNHKMSHKMELLNNNINENKIKIIIKKVKISIKDLRLPKIVEVIKIRNILITKKMLISKINLIEVEVVIRITTMNKIVEEETIEELEEGAIEMTLFAIKLTKTLSIQRKILLNNVRIQMILKSRAQTMVKETKILKEILTM